MQQSDYLKTAIDLAKHAGDIMRAGFTLNMEKEWKEDNSSVTKTDRAINELVLKTLTQKYPEHGVLSEEGSTLELDRKYLWVCDPLDGTHNFAHGLPTATFMLSLLEDGVPLLGLVYDPFLDRMFYAEKGRGAFLNETPIHVSEHKKLERSIIGVARTTETRNLYPVLQEFDAKKVRWVKGLSIGYMGALVAAGEFSAIIFGGKYAHDTAAIQILVEEAGGKSTDLFGYHNDTYTKDVKGQIASNGLLHEDILALIDTISPR